MKFILHQVIKIKTFTHLWILSDPVLLDGNFIEISDIGYKQICHDLKHVCQAWSFQRTNEDNFNLRERSYFVSM